MAARLPIGQLWSGARPVRSCAIPSWSNAVAIGRGCDGRGSGRRFLPIPVRQCLGETCCRRVYRRGLASSALFVALTTVAFYGLLVHVVVRALAGDATLGAIAVFAGASFQLRNLLERCIGSVVGALEGTLFISNLLEFLAERPRLVTRGGKVPPLFLPRDRTRRPAWLDLGRAPGAVIMSARCSG